MKTDKFDDAIRRKLESIEPPFRERDWTHMQSFMHHHGYPPAWAGVGQWLVPLSAAAAVTGLIISAVWQFHTNQQLRQSVQTLTKTVARLENTQANLIKHQPRTDTVYVTTFTKTPASVLPDQPAGSQPAQQESPVVRTEDRYTLRPEKPTGSRPERGITPGEPSRVIPGKQPQTGFSVATNERAQSAASQQPNAQPGQDREHPLVDKPTETANTAKPNRTLPSVVKTPDRTAQPAQRERLSGGNPLATNKPTARSAANQPGTYQSPEVAQAYPSARPLASGSADRQQAGSDLPPVLVNDPPATRPIVTINALGIRPMVLDSAYYVESIARRARRIRSLLPAMATPPATTAPAEVASSRPSFSGVRLRLGVAGEVGTVQRVAGVYGELLIGRHWSVGIGLNRVKLQGNRFGDEDQFKRMTHKDFRPIYAPRIDPQLNIIDIDRQFIVWQLPVNLTYRALVGKGFALIPSVGVDFGLSATENTTFTYRRGVYEHKVPGLPPERPSSLFTAYTIALGAEKSWKHFVLQASPVLSLPSQSQPDPVNPVSLGLRTRVLFQF